MNAFSRETQQNGAAQNAVGRIALARNLLRGKSLDGRDLKAVSAHDFLEDLFAVQACPPVGSFAFWTNDDGSVWLFVERELENQEASYIVAAGDMGPQGAQVTLSALAVVTEKETSEPGRRRKKVRTLSYQDGAFFIDQMGARAEAITVDRRVAEPEFMSHLRPARWKEAPRFNATKEPAPVEGLVPVDEDEDGDAGAGGEMIEASDDDPPGEADEEYAD